MLDEQRKKTLKQRLGIATELIDDDRYLPMFRNRQINNPELFEFSVQLAKKKEHPARYFASLWSKKALSRTLDWLKKLVNLAQSKTAELVRNIQKAHQERQVARELDQPINRENRRRLEKMKRKIINNPALLRG